ncbi:MAG: NUDIX hydrolase [Lachnospiraceae bacterium]|nr:NUDIX hydrolase [Lachnospiraceae bacterium]
MQYPKRIDRKKCYSGGIIDVYKDTVELSGGKTGQWDYVFHNKGGGAAVVPVLPDGNILMVRQTRPAIDMEMLELPAGAGETGENTADTAKRELGEETGYCAKTLEKLARIYSAPAYCNEFTDIYLALNVEKTGGQKLDEAEEIVVESHSLIELIAMIRKGEITNAGTVAGILAYNAYLQ